MRNGETQYTRTGNRRRASYQMVCKWVQESWDEIDVDLIVTSFQGCGLVPSRSKGALHSGLLKLIETREVPIESEHSGITDHEDSDFEDIDDLN